ncbi:type IX secretion/gliding motility protein PorT/SprT [Taibaiella lutea]|nr:porin family protein [Taibaiella lutea]
MKGIKALLLLLCLMAGLQMHAQTHIPNMPEHDQKAYYFGITFGANYSTFRINNTQSFADHDTFKSIQPGSGPGFNLGIMGNLRLTNFIDLRFIPALVFAEKKLTLVDMNNVVTKTSVESIYMQLPLQVKFKSDRINNFRFYGILGGKFDYDLASNARSRRQDELLRVKAIDLGADVGIGFEFFYPNFIFSPEIKLSQGFINTQYKDSDIPLSNTIDAIRTRMIVFSIHLEG